MGKINIKTAEEIAIMKANGLILAGAIAEIAKAVKPGINGLQLDKIAEEYIHDNGGTPSFKGLYGFPASVCISVNEEVVHGIPNARVYKDGDIISVDAGVFKNGYHSDSAYTLALGNVAEATMKLLQVTKEALFLGIAEAKAGAWTGDIGFAVQDFCERKHGYRCVRDLVGHGLGKTLHEDPQVPNYGKKGKGDKLPENCVIAIEPMINMGRKDVYTKNDNWTIATQDSKPSAHYEHTVCIRKSAAELLTTFDVIEAAVKGNKELQFV
ncbi:MAG TPA: type I methionyl aminopeptidase [Chitinophagales bacterium]